jgi:hypothetical protein
VLNNALLMNGRDASVWSIRAYLRLLMNQPHLARCDANEAVSLLQTAAQAHAEAAAIAAEEAAEIDDNHADNVAVAAPSKSGPKSNRSKTVQIWQSLFIRGIAEMAMIGGRNTAARTFATAIATMTNHTSHSDDNTMYRNTVLTILNAYRVACIGVEAAASLPVAHATGSHTHDHDDDDTHDADTKQPSVDGEPSTPHYSLSNGARRRHAIDVAHLRVASNADFFGRLIRGLRDQHNKQGVAPVIIHDTSYGGRSMFVTRDIGVASTSTPTSSSDSAASTTSSNERWLLYREEPLASVTYSDSHCGLCSAPFQSPDVNGIACSECESESFCSSTCLKQARDGYHGIECRAGASRYLSWLRAQMSDEPFVMPDLLVMRLLAIQLAQRRSLTTTATTAASSITVRKLEDKNKPTSATPITQTDIEQKLNMLCRFTDCRPIVTIPATSDSDNKATTATVDVEWEATLSSTLVSSNDEMESLIGVRRLLGDDQWSSNTDTTPDSCSAAAWVDASWYASVNEAVAVNWYSNVTRRALLLDASAYINHSCAPNSEVVVDPHASSTCAIYALKPLHVGDELSIAYVPPSLPFTKRRQRLLQTFGFLCRCSKCIEDEKLENAAPVPVTTSTTVPTS